MSDQKSFTIRSFRKIDREAVRRLCCDTGFLGAPIDPVYEDRQLFADFLTTYYTDWEPESSFVIEVGGEIRGYLLGSRKPLRNQLYSFWQNVSLFLKALTRYFRYNAVSRRGAIFDPRHVVASRLQFAELTSLRPVTDHEQVKFVWAAML